MSDPVEPFELVRMFLGEQPPLFYLEIAFRTVLIYAYALTLLRFVGQRAMGQLSLIEFFLVIALGSAVGDAMFYPEVPLLHAMLVITLVVGVDLLLDVIVARSHAAEEVMEGVTTVCVDRGVVVLDGNPLSRSVLFQKLRLQGITNLGQVEAAYLEPGGQLSVFRFDNERPGLPLVPPPTVVPYDILANESTVFRDRETRLVCVSCGTTSDPDPAGTLFPCAHCGEDEWTEACTGRRECEADRSHRGEGAGAE